MNDQAGETRIKDLAIPLYQARGWMKFLAVMLILGGVVIALTIWGLIIAWLPIWAGVVLFQAANAVEEVQLGSGRREALERALGRLKTYFMLSGIFLLIWLVITVFATLFGIGLMNLMMSEFGHEMMNGGY